jgi:hypothetical protein
LLLFQRTKTDGYGHRTHDFGSAYCLNEQFRSLDGVKPADETCDERVNPYPEESSAALSGFKSAWTMGLLAWSIWKNGHLELRTMPASRQPPSPPPKRTVARSRGKSVHLAVLPLAVTMNASEIRATARANASDRAEIVGNDQIRGNISCWSGVVALSINSSSLLPFAM